jgi:hypothetical protein
VIAKDDAGDVSAVPSSDAVAGHRRSNCFYGGCAQMAKGAVSKINRSIEDCNTNARIALSLLPQLNQPWDRA